MTKFIQLIIGPAGVGKSSYCKLIQEYAKSINRNVYVINLDPACDSYEYECSYDIKELIHIDEVMEEYGLGPNGGLIHCMEYLLSNYEWLDDIINSFLDDDYILIDCPGQIELYSHLPIMKNIAKNLVNSGNKVVSVYLIDALYILEPSKFIAGCMLSLSTMLQLELPHINVITKCDLVKKEDIDIILDNESSAGILRYEKYPLQLRNSKNLKKFNNAMGSIIDDFMLVSFATLDPNDEEMINDLLNKIDYTIQYGEDLEGKEPNDFEDEDTLADNYYEHLNH